jgi:glycosyltransferase involved in cell wall biosynthesis
MGGGLRYLFDLTTSAQWIEPAVGILRVEQELARRARGILGDEVDFCVYERSSNRFLAIDDAAAAEILAGKLQVAFPAVASAASPPAAESRLASLRRRIRRAMRTNATLYRAFQRLRGRRFTLEEILQIQSEEFSDGDATPPKTRRIEPLANISRGPAKLSASTCIISGGFDWQYKDLRSIWALKQSLEFRYCAIIYDLIPLSFPHFVMSGYGPFVADYFGELIWIADCAMCISGAARTEWAEFSASFGVETIPSHVFSLGCDLPVVPIRSDLPEALRGKRFALFVSTIEPRKNHRVLYDAWDRCIRSGTVDADRDRMVFVGRIGWAVDDLMREIAANPATRDTIVILNSVSDDLLALLYRECAFVVFPSFAEGYGLPVAEALGYGKPTISSDAGSLAEIGNGLVQRVDPKDTLGWANAIARYLASPEELDAWSRRIKAEHRPVTWDATASHFFSRVRETVS